MPATRTQTSNRRLPPQGHSHTSKPNMGWGNGMRSGARKARKVDRKLFIFLFPLRLTDNIRFHLRIGSHSQMSRSGNYREVLGTS